jgi:hypothetical protein
MGAFLIGDKGFRIADLGFGSWNLEFEIWDLGFGTFGICNLNNTASKDFRLGRVVYPRRCDCSEWGGLRQASNQLQQSQLRR